MFCHVGVVCLCHCVHPEAVLNAAFCMTCSLLVKDVRGDHMEDVYSRAGLMTSLYVTINVSLCLPHPVAVSDFLFVEACVRVMRCC